MKYACQNCHRHFDITQLEVGTTQACPICGREFVRPEEYTVPGIIIGDFELKQEGCREEGCRVFLACQLSLDRLVELKLLEKEQQEDKQALEKFLAEARRRGEDSTDNAVYSVGCDEESEIYYLAREPKATWESPCVEPEAVLAAPSSPPGDDVFRSNSEYVRNQREAGQALGTFAKFNIFFAVGRLVVLLVVLAVLGAVLYKNYPGLLALKQLLDDGEGEMSLETSENEPQNVISGGPVTEPGKSEAPVGEANMSGAGESQAAQVTEMVAVPEKSAEEIAAEAEAKRRQEQERLARLQEENRKKREEAEARRQEQIRQWNEKAEASRQAAAKALAARQEEERKAKLAQIAREDKKAGEKLVFATPLDWQRQQLRQMMIECCFRSDYGRAIKMLQATERSHGASEEQRQWAAAWGDCLENVQKFYLKIAHSDKFLNEVIVHNVSGKDGRNYDLMLENIENGIANFRRLPAGTVFWGDDLSSYPAVNVRLDRLSCEQFAELVGKAGTYGATSPEIGLYLLVHCASEEMLAPYFSRMTNARWLMSEQPYLRYAAVYLSIQAAPNREAAAEQAERLKNMAPQVYDGIAADVEGILLRKQPTAQNLPSLEEQLEEEIK